MACLMVSGVTFAVIYQTLPGPDALTTTAVVHERKAEDLLAIAFDTPIAGDPCDGDTLAEKWIIRGVNGDETDFERRKNKTFGEEIPTNLILDNLEENMLLYEEFTGYGSAAASRTFEPDWSEAIAKNRLGHVAGTDKLTVEVLGSSDSHLLAVKGAAVEARVRFTDTHVANKWGWTALPQGPHLWEGGSNISLNTANGGPTTTLQLDPPDVGPTRGLKDIRINVTSLFGGASATSNLTVGTILTVHLPPHWTDLTNSSAEWQASPAYGSDETGWTQNFTLTSKTNGTAMVYITAKPPLAPTYPFDVIELDLSNGSLGHAEIVVKYPAVPEDGLPRTVHTTMPYPLVPGSQALFGVTVANGGAQATVNQIDIELPDGYDLARLDGEAPEIFGPGNPVPLTEALAHGGNWTRVSGSHVRWNGSYNITANDVEEWLVSINITDDPLQATAVELNTSSGVESILRFSNGYLHRSTSWGRAPGVIRHVVPPESVPGARDGYPHADLAAGTSQSYSYDVWLRRPGVNLTTTGSYVALPDDSDISSVQNALGNARIALPTRKIPLGHIVPVEQDFSSLGASLASEGIGGFVISTDLYAPATLACEPVWSWTRASEGLPLSGIVDLEFFDYDGVGSADVFLIGADETVYRVNGLGVTVWSEKVDSLFGELTDIATGLVGGESAVFVGTAGGQVLRVDPSGLGLVEWSGYVMPSTVPGASTAIRELTIDPANGTLLVRADKVLELRDAEDGSIRGRLDLGSRVVYTDNVFVAAEWGPDGYIYAASTHLTYKLDPTHSLLNDVASVAIENPLGLAATPAGIIIAKVDGVEPNANDPTSFVFPLTLANTPVEHDHSGSSILAAKSGDVTGDGVRDLAVVTSALDVEILSGATGTVVKVFSASLGQFTQVTGWGVSDVLPGPMYEQNGNIYMEGLSPRPQRGCGGSGARYTQVVPCVGVNDPRDLQAVVTRLVGKHGHVMVAYTIGDLAHVTAWRFSDERMYDWNMEAPGQGTALDVLPRTGSPDLFAIGTNDGKLRIANEDSDTTQATETYAPDVEPTSQVGHFYLRVPIPAGGFYGTHVLVTRVGWSDPVRGAQEVTMADWFNVVSGDGHPVLAPAYRLHLAVRDPAAGLP